MYTYYIHIHIYIYIYIFIYLLMYIRDMYLYMLGMAEEEGGVTDELIDAEANETLTTSRLLDIEKGVTSDITDVSDSKLSGAISVSTDVLAASAIASVFSIPASTAYGAVVSKKVKVPTNVRASYIIAAPQAR
jgi:hypothetical protein